MKEMSTKSIIVKVFIRDDILEQVSSGGFTALTHVTSRRANKLTWSEDQILTLIVKRLFSNSALCEFLSIDPKQFETDLDYCRHAFRTVFPEVIAEHNKKTPTLKWICDHIMDGQDVVTPRDVIELLSKARQFQVDEFNRNPTGHADYVLGEKAIRYGYAELSKHKKDTLLRAEFPHLWGLMERFELGRSEYKLTDLIGLIGRENQKSIEDLVSIGFLKKKRIANSVWYSIPHVYRECLSINS
jgi:hypothetical protein